MVTKLPLLRRKSKTWFEFTKCDTRFSHAIATDVFSRDVFGKFLKLGSFSSTLLSLFTQHTIWGWFGAYYDEGEPKHATMATRSARDWQSTTEIAHGTRGMAECHVARTHVFPDLTSRTFRIDLRAS